MSATVVLAIIGLIIFVCAYLHYRYLLAQSAKRKALIDAAAPYQEQIDKLKQESTRETQNFKDELAKYRSRYGKSPNDGKR